MCLFSIQMSFIFMCPFLKPTLFLHTFCSKLIYRTILSFSLYNTDTNFAREYYLNVEHRWSLESIEINISIVQSFNIVSLLGIIVDKDATVVKIN